MRCHSVLIFYLGGLNQCLYRLYSRTLTISAMGIYLVLRNQYVKVSCADFSNIRQVPAFLSSRYSNNKRNCSHQSETRNSISVLTLAHVHCQYFYFTVDISPSKTSPTSNGVRRDLATRDRSETSARAL